MKLFSTRTHGALDYLSVGALIALPRLLKWSKPTTDLLTASAVATLAYSLLTDYEWGAVKTLPMKTHLALDGMSGIAIAAAPFLLLKEDEATTAALVGIGLFEITASLTTETTPENEK